MTLGSQTDVASAWLGTDATLPPVATACLSLYATGARLHQESFSRRPEYPGHHPRTSYFLPQPRCLRAHAET